MRHLLRIFGQSETTFESRGPGRWRLERYVRLPTEVTSWIAIYTVRSINSGGGVFLEAGCCSIVVDLTTRRVKAYQQSVKLHFTQKTLSLYEGRCLVLDSAFPLSQVPLTVPSMQLENSLYAQVEIYLFATRVCSRSPQPTARACLLIFLKMLCPWVIEERAYQSRFLVLLNLLERALQHQRPLPLELFLIETGRVQTR